ncbi:hypothetical protein ACFQ3C_17560 [Seohaeicola saemankumensis]|uniref:Lipoprotein n=1 Tax=Seohaeicola saemankumensis TaxID=481181 RepID=A0ABW3THP8_9RHOB
MEHEMAAFASFFGLARRAGRQISLAIGLACLCGCAAIGIGASEALVVMGAGVAGIEMAAIANRQDNGDEPKISGTYKEGFWFDRELYSVSVASMTAQEAETLARATARDSCAARGKVPSTVSENAFEATSMLGPSKFRFEMKFRCRDDAAEG